MAITPSRCNPLDDVGEHSPTHIERKAGGVAALARDSGRQRQCLIPYLFVQEDQPGEGRPRARHDYLLTVALAKKQMLDACPAARLAQQIVSPFRAQQFADLTMTKANTGIDDVIENAGA